MSNAQPAWSSSSNAAPLRPAPREQLDRNNMLLFIPAYNCANQLERVLSTLPQRLPSCISEVIVVNNRSKDSTEEKIKNYVDSLSKRGSCPFRYLLNDENYGLGGSHKVAYQYAIKNGFSGVVTLHGDDQANLEDFRDYLEAWSRGMLTVDAILGSRFAAGSKIRGYSLHRTWGNHLLNALWSTLLGTKISDIGSGLNFISTDAIRKLDFTRLPDSLVFNPQQLLQLIGTGAQVTFVPIEWKEEDQESNAIPWKVFLMSLKQAINYRLGVTPPLVDRPVDRYTSQIMASGHLRS